LEVLRVRWSLTGGEDEERVAGPVVFEAFVGEELGAIGRDMIKITILESALRQLHELRDSRRVTYQNDGHPEEQRTEKREGRSQLRPIMPLIIGHPSESGIKRK
jgi:hypothetical protein